MEAACPRIRINSALRLSSIVIRANSAVHERKYPIPMIISYYCPSTSGCPIPGLADKRKINAKILFINSLLKIAQPPFRSLVSPFIPVKPFAQRV